MQDEKDVKQYPSDLPGSPNKKRQVLGAGQQGRETLDVTEGRPKQGNTSTKVIGAKLPSTLPPIKNARNNNTYLRQVQPTNIVSKTQRLQNPKVSKQSLKLQIIIEQ